MVWRKPNIQIMVSDNVSSSLRIVFINDKAAERNSEFPLLILVGHHERLGLVAL